MQGHKDDAAGNAVEKQPDDEHPSSIDITDGQLQEWIGRTLGPKEGDLAPDLNSLSSSVVNAIKSLAETTSAKKSFLLWQKEHAAAFAASGKTHPVVDKLEDACAIHPGLRQLGDREWEVLVYFDCHRRNPGVVRWLDVSQRLQRTPDLKNGCLALPCVTPNAIFVIPDRMRVALGYEKLLAQGIRYGPAGSWRDLIVRATPDHTLSSLAGNAMAVPCLSASFFVLHGLLAAAKRVSLTGRLPP